MNFWKNTTTLDRHCPELRDCVSLADAEIAVLGTGYVDLEKATSLRGLFRCGVGVENVPFKACEERGILVGLPSEDTRRAIYDETASFAIHLILTALYRGQGDSESWSKANRVALIDREVLILGAGNIGSRVAEWMRPLCRVQTWDVLTDSAESLPRLVETADVISLHFPLSRETEGWFNKTYLQVMKDGSALVNTARGSIVDEQDLYEEVSTGRIHALFDVFWTEPYKGKLSTLPESQFAMSPHISSHSERFLRGLADDLRTFAQSL